MKLVFNRAATHQRVCEEAVRQGLQALDLCPEDIESNAAACWSWHTGARLHQQGRDVLVFERGYIDRFEYVSVAWNGLNGRAVFPDYPDDHGSRFEACRFTLKPAREGGGRYVLLIGQVHTDAAVRHVNIWQWYAHAVKEARRFGLPIVFRPHPKERYPYNQRAVTGTITHRGSLQEALDDAAVVYTFSSNTGVDALLNGNYTIVHDMGGMAYPVAAHAPSEPMADQQARQKWAYALAQKQWTLDEISRGMGLREALEQKRRTW